MAEFKLINQFINRVEVDSSVVLGIGDDAAVLDVPPGFQIIQTMDTMVENVHFDERFSADALAHKLLHVNLSDIAAMGGFPKWATVALTMPSVNSDQHVAWLDEFSRGLQSRSAELDLNLVGGDTTSGPLSVSMNLTGLVESGRFITRHNAKSDDDIYVSGHLGDAALALTEQGYDNPDLIKRLLYPQARLHLGEKLYDIANACLDISDGLLADLTHICRSSHVFAQINVEKIPVSTAYQRFFQDQIDLDFALNGGDDYELCFTASISQREKVQLLSQQVGHQITRVGKITKRPYHDDEEPIALLFNNRLYHCKRKGWEHFA